jgi:hypothetical protein
MEGSKMNKRTVWTLGAGVAGLAFAGCFSGSSAPVGHGAGPTLPDATADDASSTGGSSGADGGLADAADATTTDDAAPVLDATDEAMTDATVVAVADASPDADAAPCESSTAATHVLLTFDSNDPEFVSSVEWIDSTGTTTTNWSAYGGPSHCTDPQEFFGQAYAAPESTDPLPVVGGHLATLDTASTCDATTSTITSGPLDCTDAAQLPVTTTYNLYGGARADEVKITRSFGFDGSDAAVPVYSGTGLRPYVPRVTLATFANVIYPNQAATAVTTVAASSCPGDCLTPQGATWNGKWFADIAASGYAIIVLRDPAMTSPVDLTVNWDSYSESNLASFVLVQPVAGWQSPITEVEYLCFADLTTWPQTQRDAAVLPTWCGQ